MHDNHETEVKQQTFMALYEPVHTRFARFCQARAGNPADSKELISETVLRVYENLHQLRDHKAFLGFLFGTATNILKSKERRRKFWGIFQAHDATEKYADKQNPETATDVKLLYEALQQLPEEQREAIILFEISGFSLKEVQEIQKVSLSAVKSRIVRGKRKLARLLRDQETQDLLNKNLDEEEQFIRSSRRTNLSVSL